jgi:hypothetical protein
MNEAAALMDNALTEDSRPVMPRYARLQHDKTRGRWVPWCPSACSSGRHRGRDPSHVRRRAHARRHHRRTRQQYVADRDTIGTT